jgi:hypothetical protein
MKLGPEKIAQVILSNDPSEIRRGSIINQSQPIVYSMSIKTNT